MTEAWTLWGINPVIGKFPIKITGGALRSCRAELKRRKGEGWIGLAIYPKGQPYGPVATEGGE